ncbi:LPP20 family lipoprotein [Desulfobacterium sp. N47]|uniref:LPP20 family lipoprotein n=1 Tax=Desulfobacterium sp. N47 TaxID=3115210 RepID=UPI003F4A283D
MKIKKVCCNILLGFMMVCLGIGLFACAEKVPPKPELVMEREFDGAPDWVTKGCNSHKEDKKSPSKICGVGSCGSTRNPSLARESAIGRARTEIARKLQTKITSMLKDYQSTTTGGENFGNQAADEQHIVHVSKQITDMSLSGTEMVDSWVSKNGNFYALVVYDVDKFKDSVNQIGNLNESIRKAVIERADKAFEDLDAQTANECQ